MTKARQLADLGNAYDDGALSNRNLIINGAMQVAQRGTSFSSNNSIDYTVDRWAIFSNGVSTTTQESFTAGQTDVPNEPVQYLKWNISTYSSGDNLFQRIEDVRTGAGQAVTLSFYAKADSSITNRPRLIQNFGSGGSSEVVTLTSTNALTTSWQKFTITATLPSISGKTIGSSSYLELETLRFTETFTGGVYITGVQLEVGDTATPFEHRSYGDELAKCLRYYWRNGASVENKLYYRYGGHGESVAYNQAQINQFFPVPMRANPTLTASGVISWYSNGAIVNPSGAFSVDGNSGGKYMTTVVNSTLTGLTSARAGAFISNNNTTSFMEWDAEL